MKPHIYLHCGLWFCEGALIVAHGNSPINAFRNWNRQYLTEPMP